MTDALFWGPSAVPCQSACSDTKTCCCPVLFCLRVFPRPTRQRASRARGARSVAVRARALAARRGLSPANPRRAELAGRPSRGDRVAMARGARRPAAPRGSRTHRQANRSPTYLRPARDRTVMGSRLSRVRYDTDRYRRGLNLRWSMASPRRCAPTAGGRTRRDAQQGNHGQRNRLGTQAHYLRDAAPWLRRREGGGAAPRAGAAVRRASSKVAAPPGAGQIWQRRNESVRTAAV